MFTVQTIGSPDWLAAAKALAVSAEEKAFLVAERALTAVVAWLKQRTAEDRGWQNRTGMLESSYSGEVERIPGGAKLTIRVDAAHAIFLEARDGLFVLNGVTSRGGPFERSLVEAVRAVAPDWRVTLTG